MRYENPTEQADLLRMVLSNCAMDNASVYPSYKKPFDAIFRRAEIRGMARPAGLEPATAGLEILCSIL